MTAGGASYLSSTPIILDLLIGGNGPRKDALQHEVHANEVQSQFIVCHCVRHPALTSYYVCFRLALLWDVCLP